jgi:glycosyltransferase involved in cell wall biosynthesis
MALIMPLLRTRDFHQSEYYIDYDESEWNTRKELHFEDSKVSIVVPTLNNESTLGKALSSFVEQDHPSKEIVVVDGGSSDRTLEIAEEYADKILEVPGPCGLAVYRGLQESTGAVTALLDSDVQLPRKSWLSRAIKGFNIADNVSTVWPLNVPPPSAAILTRTYFNHWREIVEDRIASQRGLLGGGNSLFRADLLSLVAPLAKETHWGDDFVRSAELRKRGYKIVVYRDPIYHNTMTCFKEFYRKQRHGAQTFMPRGFDTMGLRLGEVAYEQYVLGTFSMLRNLSHGDISSLLFPAYILARTFAYAREGI